MFIIHIRFIVFVAIDAGKYLEIGGQVTIGTGQPGMVAGTDRKLVIEYRLLPGDMGGPVTGFAIGREARLLVIGVAAVFIVLAVTTITIGGQIVTLRMTGIAIQVGMRPLQPEKLVMIEHRPAPRDVFAAVAGHAVGGETGLLVIGVGGVVILLLMTTDTFPGQTRVLTAGVAIGTGSGLMPAP